MFSPLEKESKWLQAIHSVSVPCIFHLTIYLGNINIAISIRNFSLLFIIAAYYFCILYCVDIYSIKPVLCW